MLKQAKTATKHEFRPQGSIVTQMCCEFIKYVFF